MSATPRAMVAAALATLAGTSHAATRCVNPKGTGMCTATIQAAVDASGPNDVVIVYPGTYHEGVVVAAGKDGLEIDGTTTAAVVVDPDIWTGIPAPLAGITIRSPKVKVRRVTIRNGSQGIAVEADGAVLQNLRILGPHGAGSLVGNGVLLDPDVKGTQIVANDFRAVAGAAVFSSDLGNDDTLIKGNTITGAGLVAFAEGNNYQIVTNRVTNSGGIFLEGDGVDVSGNSFEDVFEAIAVDGNTPVVDHNVSTASGFSFASVACLGACDGSSVSGNVVSGSANGIVAFGKTPGMVVQKNRVSVGDTSYALSGTGIRFTLNTATSANSQCVLVQGDAIEVSKNVATRCFGAGYYVTGTGNTIAGNTATSTGAYGFEVDGHGGSDRNTFTNNAATNVVGQGFGTTNGATGSTFTGNKAAGNRVDFCSSDGDPVVPIAGNAFKTQSAACDMQYLIDFDDTLARGGAR